MSNLFPEINDNLSGTFPEAIDLDSPMQNIGDSSGVNLYLMRHASTDIDDQDKAHGWLDEPLNDKGIEESKQIADQLKGVKINQLLTSDLQRARQTGYFVSGVTGTHPEPTSDLRPLDLGKYSGMKHSDAHEALNPIYDKWNQDPTSKIPGGESFKDFQDRNQSVLDRIASMPEGSNVAVVGHSMTMRLFQDLIEKGKTEAGKMLKNVGDEPFMKRFKIKQSTPETVGVRG